VEELSKLSAREVLDDHLGIANRWGPCQDLEEIVAEDLRRNVSEQIVIPGQLLASPLPDGCEEGTSVYCSVRPEKIFLDDLEDGMVSVEGEIVERIYLGTTTQVIIQLAPDMRMIALEQNTDRSRADDRWEIGGRVRLGWHPEHARVLR
jgi:spermidine/putrescine transport system ATP-binding protein